MVGRWRKREMKLSRIQIRVRVMAKVDNGDSRCTVFISMVGSISLSTLHAQTDDRPIGYRTRLGRHQRKPMAITSRIAQHLVLSEARAQQRVMKGSFLMRRREYRTRQIT